MFSKKKLINTAYLASILEAFTHLTPQYLIVNPVMFVTYIGAWFLTFLFLYSYFLSQNTSLSFIFQVTLWVWLTVIFSNFSEFLAKRKGKAQAQFLKKTSLEVQAKKINSIKDRNYVLTPAGALRHQDIVLVEKGDIIPGDGEVLLGVAGVDESSITGESAPVIRESGGDRNSVTGGTVVLSDWLVVKITCNPGETFLDHMIALIEGGAKKQKTPNETTLGILLAGMSIIFLIVVMTLLPFSLFSVSQAGKGEVISLSILIALLISLIPTTIGGLMSTISIGGMNRLIQHNVIVTSCGAVEAAGDVTLLLLDKTGTITVGNRQAVTFYPAQNTSMEELAQCAALSSFSDETSEGRSILALAQRYPLNSTLKLNEGTFFPFSAETRFSGIEIDGKKILKGAVDKMINFVKKHQGTIDETLLKKINEIARQGSTPLVVATQEKVLGVIELKDTIKPGIKERLSELRMIGIKSIMITGDNPITAATISNEIGVDDFYAQATPEIKLKLIRQFQDNDQLVAMVGDGANDAPALAQTDVAVAMNIGTQQAKEAANMVDLDSDPTKLIEIVKIGKQMLITRGALTLFSMTSDVAKYFSIIPITFSLTVPGLKTFNIMHLSTPQSAVLSTLIFNAIIIIFLSPLAFRGVKTLPNSAGYFFGNTLIYSIGGLIIPFIGIKIIDMLIGFAGVI